MKEVIHLGPGSDLPLWIEALDRTVFGEAWGALDEHEHVWALPGEGFSRWRLVPTLEEAELLRIAVFPEVRGRGLGRRLLNLASKACAELGMRTLLLEVRPSNTAARALYASEGWREVGLRPRYYRDGEDAVLCSRELTS